MDYKQAMEYINNTSKFGTNLGLGRVTRLLEYMGNPQKYIKCIHVAGTNGKGSVTSMISSILIESGYRVGMYTSPHLQRFTERIKINNNEIPELHVARIITEMKPFVDRIASEGYDHPTEFEIITCAMFKYFYENNVDFGVIEVGLGGRLDATNVINPLVSVITAISYDHMNILGDTLGSIAYEKAGIIKENGVAVTYPQGKEALDIIYQVCSQKNAVLIQADGSGLRLKEYSPFGQTFDLEVDGELYKNISTGLVGQHQLLNTCTAVTALKSLKRHGIDIERDAIYRGMRNVKWPGRLEVASTNPMILLDGAHNMQGATSLKSALEKYFKYDKMILVMGILRDKQIDEMCSTIMPMASTVIAVQPISSRALGYKELLKIAEGYCSDSHGFSHLSQAVEYGIGRTGRDGLLVFCGSLYMIGHVRDILEESGILAVPQ